MDLSHLKTLADSFAPQRKILPNPRSMTGMMPVHRKQTHFESALERDYLVLLDFSPAVLEVVEQPIRLWYRDSLSVLRRYTPDFFIRYGDRPPELCEVKYRVDLRKDWAALKPKFREARRFAMANGVRFRIVTEVEIRKPFLRNVSFLRHHRTSVDSYARNHLLGVMRLLGVTTPHGLLQAAYWIESDRCSAVAAIWQLLLERHISADLSEPLTMASPIRFVTREERLWAPPHSSLLP